jgi:hypothetical protein
MPLDQQIDDFGRSLDKVMRELEKSLLDVIGGATSSKDIFDSTALLNSQPAMIEALRTSGYFTLAEEHVATFAAIPKDTIAAFKARDLPLPEFTTVDKEAMTALAQMDLDQFNNIGVSAMNELRLGMVRNAVSGAPFSTMVESVRAATIGLDKKGSPLANYAYTHANTSILNFQGEVMQQAGVSVGFTEDDDLWEVEGVLDGVTRDICVSALNNPIRTKAEWQSAGYWGGSPGGWNCRHQLFPYFGELDGVTDEAEFVSAKTVSEVEARMKAVGVKDVDLSGLPLNIANGALLAVETNPISGLRAIGTMNKSGRTGMAYYSAGNSKIFLNTPVLKRELKKAPITLDARIEALNANKAEWVAARDNSKASSSFRLKAGKQISKLNEAIGKHTATLDSGVGPKVFNTASLGKTVEKRAELIMTHEIGHHLHDNGRLVGLPTARTPEFLVSEYAATNASEFAAENYAAWKVLGAGSINENIARQIELALERSK